MKLAGFPILIPAFTAQIYIDEPLPITPDLTNIPFLPRTGSLTSEPSYPYKLHARFIQGSDFLRRDRDGGHVRLDVSSTAEDVSTGAIVRFNYNGVLDMEGQEGAVIRGDRNASSTGFGNIFIQVRFETEGSELQAIENKLYVGSGRFLVQEDRPVIVEYRISEVVAMCD